MSLGIDPIISNFFFSLNLIPHFAKVRRAETIPHSNSFPFVTVIVALYKEKPEDIAITVSSLMAQTYPKDRFEILFALEPDEKETINEILSWTEKLGRIGIAARTILSDGKSRTKPHALNQAIQWAAGEYCVFYDASDEIDRDQIEKGICLMTEGGYDVVQSRVLRKGSSILSRFLLLDTAIWYWKYLPVLSRFCGGFPLSGEGLFIKKSVLQEAGCFPEVLTEDALLGMMLTQRGKRFGILDSLVIEKAPKNLRSHIRQKLRWHRGYLTCLRKLISIKMPLRQRFFFFLPFSVPLTAGLAFLGWSLTLLALIARMVLGQLHINSSWADSGAYFGLVHYWSFFLAYIGIPLTVLSTIHVTWCIKLLDHAPMALLMPLYWVFVGFCSICSFFRGTADWGKTER